MGLNKAINADILSTAFVWHINSLNYRICHAEYLLFSVIFFLFISAAVNDPEWVKFVVYVWDVEKWRFFSRFQYSQMWRR